MLRLERWRVAADARWATPCHRRLGVASSDTSWDALIPRVMQLTSLSLSVLHYPRLLRGHPLGGYHQSSNQRHPQSESIIGKIPIWHQVGQTVRAKQA